MNRFEGGRRVLGIAVWLGGAVGALLAIASAVVGIIVAWQSGTLTSTLIWLPLLPYGAFIAALVGAGTGIAAWALASLGVLLVDPQRRHSIVRGATVGVGAMAGAALSLWAFTAWSRIEILGPGIAGTLIAGALGIAVLIVTDRMPRPHAA